jgi:hypothetical protein
MSANQQQGKESLTAQFEEALRTTMQYPLGLDQAATACTEIAERYSQSLQTENDRLRKALEEIKPYMAAKGTNGNHWVELIDQALRPDGKEVDNSLSRSEIRSAALYDIQKILYNDTDSSLEICNKIAAIVREALKGKEVEGE